MKKIPVESAVGMELCHDITAMRDGFKGAAFKRGHIITEEDIPKLLDIGKKTIFVWEENAGEIHEEEAALRMAAMAPVDGAHYTEPSEGKVLLFADKRGMLRVDTELLREINSIGDITICTLRDQCVAGQLSVDDFFAKYEELTKASEEGSEKDSKKDAKKEDKKTAKKKEKEAVKEVAEAN